MFNFYFNSLTILTVFVGLNLISSTVIYADDKVKSDDKVFVVIPKFTHPFFERTKLGCKKAASELDHINCRYEPPRSFDVREQVRILEDMLSLGVDGIAIAPISSKAIARTLELSNKKKIPIITFDSDLIEKDRHLRKSYIGSHNKSIGEELGKLLNILKPEGGKLLIQAGEPPAENIKERLEGFLSVIDSKKWTQIPGSPMYCDAKEQTAVQQLEDTLSSIPDLNAFVALGAWPHVAKRGYQEVVSKHMDRVESGDLVLLAADTLNMQIELLEGNYTQGLVGQNPYEMGYLSIYTLKKILKEGVEDLPDPIFTGLDICTIDNIDICKNLSGNIEQ